MHSTNMGTRIVTRLAAAAVLLCMLVQGILLPAACIRLLQLLQATL